MEVIAVASQKGGAGKTPISVNGGRVLMERNTTLRNFELTCVRRSLSRSKKAVLETDIKACHALQLKHICWILHRSLPIFGP